MSSVSRDTVILIRGFLLVMATILVIASEVFSIPELRVGAGVLGAAFLLWVTRSVKASRQLFVAVGVVISVLALVLRDDGLDLVAAALSSGGYVLGFFVGLSTLRTAAMTSPSIQECGEYLSTRTPGKRYLALTLGGHLFSLVLNYGSISLLGALVEKADGGDGKTLNNPVRVRRMMLAIQRGFVATLCWSPLTFSLAMGTAVIEGSSWGGVVWYGLGAAVLLMGVGWILDTVFKPTPTQGAQRSQAVGSIASTRPLLILLVSIFSLVGVLEILTGMRVVIVVMIVVPLISLIWIALQNRQPSSHPNESLAGVLFRRSAGYIGAELDGYKGEMVLLYIAAYVGKLGGALALPYMTAQGFDLSQVPTPLILFLIIIGLPALGQVGMHPIMAVTMFGPMLPSPEAMGISPNILLLTVCIGWSFGGATSPFTATVLLVAMYGRVKATVVGLVWNRLFVAFGSLVGIAWVMAMSGLLL